MRKLLTVFVLFISVLAHSQMPEPYLGECESAGAEGGEWVQKSMRAVLQGNMQMGELYAKKALDADDNDPHAFYIMGEVALRTGNVRAAEAFWTRCLEICPDYKAELQYFLGVMYMESGKTTRGEEMIEKYLDNPMRDGGYDREAERYLEQTRIVNELMTHPVEYDPKVVPGVSTRADEYFPTVSPDGQICLFTRRSMQRGRHSGPADRERLVEEFTISRHNGRGFDSGEPMPAPFNQSYNEGAPALSADNRVLVFASCERGEGAEAQKCDLYYAIRNGDSWSQIMPMGEGVNRPDSWEGQPSISANGDVVYFASNREGGMGGTDIYVSYRQPDGTWSEAENLGAPINTSGFEKTPFIHSDSRTLYFSSDTHPGLGGYDIFYARRKDNMEFDDPINIGYPINGQDNEWGLFVTFDGQNAYFGSNKLNGPGGYDLYRFTLPEEARPQEVAFVRGVLKDEEGEIVRDADLLIKNVTTREIQRVDVDDASGEYTAVVTLGGQSDDVIIKVDRDDAAFNSKYIDVDQTESGMIEADMEVSEIAVGREYRLNDINFASNSYQLDNNAYTIIEEFGLFLEDHPAVKVDIQGHTDNVGDDAANLALSKNRARVVYEYLIELGVSPSRLTHHGYGEQRPIASNDSSEGKAKNRRTVFIITQL